MANLGPRGPEHSGNSIRFHRNRSWRTSGPTSPVETRQAEPTPPARDCAPPLCRTCKSVSDCVVPRHCFGNDPRRDAPPANSPVRTQELLDEDEAGCE